MQEMSGEQMSNKGTTPNCNMHEALVAHLYDEATPEESRRVEAHLTECSLCKQEFQAFERVRGMLQQWQLDDLPVLRVVAEKPGSRSMLAVLRELFTITPLWAKALSGVAMALVVLAVIGTDVSVGRGGVSFRADLLRRDRTASPDQMPVPRDVPGIEQVRNDMKNLVHQLIAENEQQRREVIKAQLIGFESQLQEMRSADLLKLTARIQEHQQRLRSLEQDIDRREGLDLTDILFSEVSRPAERSANGGD
jgi:hypothetical protein